MKTKLIIAALFLSVVGFSQRVIIQSDSVKTICITGMQPLQYDSLSGGNQTIFDSFISMSNNNTTPIVNPLKSIQLIGTSSSNGVFTISGANGFPITIGVWQLTGSNATIKNNFYTFVQAATGQPLTSLIANFDGTNMVTINGIKFRKGQADSASGGLVSQAEYMCLKLLNGANP